MFPGQNTRHKSLLSGPITISTGRKCWPPEKPVSFNRTIIVVGTIEEILVSAIKASRPRVDFNLQFTINMFIGRSRLEGVQILVQTPACPVQEAGKKVSFSSCAEE